MYNEYMAQHSLVPISNSTPVRLTPVGTHSGMDITIQNVNSSGYIYLGVDSTVSSSNYGFRILPNHSISFELQEKDAFFAIASASDMNAAVIKISLETQH
jgi:hypothetical protein